MGRIIITRRQLNLLKEHLSETIDPSEAYNDKNSIQTVIDGKRGVGFIVIYSPRLKQYLDDILSAGLKIIGVGANNAYVFYREGFEKDAQRLAQISKKNRGYLPTNTPEETYEIGILLGYNEEPVKQFVLDKFPDYVFNK